jgi:hypothetical protein
MSRYTNVVDPAAASQVFGVELTGTVIVAHGYDEPCAAYFCDVEPDCEVGIFTGGIGLTTQMSQPDYAQAMQALGLDKAAQAVMLDLPY